MLNAIVLAGVLATLIALGAGIVSMAKGGIEDEARSNALMARRVALQALTLVFVFVALLSQVG